MEDLLKSFQYAQKRVDENGLQSTQNVLKQNDVKEHQEQNPDILKSKMKGRIFDLMKDKEELSHYVRTLLNNNRSLINTVKEIDSDDILMKELAYRKIIDEFVIFMKLMEESKPTIASSITLKAQPKENSFYNQVTVQAFLEAMREVVSSY